MAFIDSSGGLNNNNNSPKGGRYVLKKGPWTTSEDMILIEYVKKHGEGNWNAVQRNSGLMRCGKSCRLRWANHLRPNLKKGAFMPEEEKLIVELHAKLGNKWARMAAQLPGRTDNEIKNYWNMRSKKRQRSGLPIYPKELIGQERHHHQLNSASPQQYSSISTLLVSSNNPPNPNPNPLHFFNAFTSPSPMINQHNSQYNNPNSAFYGNDNLNLLPMPSLLQYNSGSEISSVIGLPSIQYTSVQDRTHTPLDPSSDFVMMTPSDNCAEDYELMEQRSNKSGLLEDLLGESHQNLASNEMTEESFNITAADEEGYEHQQKSSFINTDCENKETNVDDDLLDLLDSFPLSVPIPDWNEGKDQNESPNLTNGTTIDEIESQVNVTEYNTVTATSSSAANQEWNFGSCFWNNMPSIY